MDIVEDIRAYLLADADFNRAWTDGRRGPGHLYQDASYKARRIELAERRERWAAELSRLRSDNEKLTWQVRDTCRRAEKAEDVIAEARRRLAKGRPLWNGPCHECDAVLRAGLSEDEWRRRSALSQGPGGENA